MSLEPGFSALSVVLTADTQAAGEHLQKGIISTSCYGLTWECRQQTRWCQYSCSQPWRAAGGKPIPNACVCPCAVTLQGRESITLPCPRQRAQGALTSDKPQRWEELVSGINIICKQLSSYCSFRAVLRSKGSLQSVISPITIKIY